MSIAAELRSNRRLRLLAALAAMLCALLIARELAGFHAEQRARRMDAELSIAERSALLERVVRYKAAHADERTPKRIWVDGGSHATAALRLQQQLGSWASAEDAQLLSAEPVVDTQGETYAEVGSHMRLASSSLALTRFLERVARSESLLTVRALSVARRDADERLGEVPMLDVEIEIIGYRPLGSEV